MSSSSSSSKNSSSSSFSLPIANNHHHRHSHYNDHDDQNFSSSRSSKRFRSITTEPISTSWNNDDIDISFKNDFSTGQIFEPFVPTTKRLRREQSNCYDVVTTSRTTKDNTAAITTIDTVNVATSAAPFVEGRDIDVLYDVGDSSRISAAIDDESCCSRSRHLFSSPPYTTVTGMYRFSCLLFFISIIFFSAHAPQLLGGADL